MIGSVRCPLAYSLERRSRNGRAVAFESKIVGVSMFSGVGAVIFIKKKAGNRGFLIRVHIRCIKSVLNKMCSREVFII